MEPTRWPRLIVISDTARGPVELWLQKLEGLLAAAQATTVEVQLRDRQLPIRERQRLGEVLRALTRRHGQSFSVNDRLDLAVLLDADAVHLSELSVSADEARSYAGRQNRRWRVSAACHSPEQFAMATADALLLSPVMEARKDRSPLGFKGLRAAERARHERPAALGDCRLYALGGVTRHDARALLDAGADGVALIGELYEPDAPEALLRALRIER